MSPVTACGQREVAFMIGTEPHETIAFAEPGSGRLVVPLHPARGRLIPSPAHPMARQFIS